MIVGWPNWNRYFWFLNCYSILRPVQWSQRKKRSSKTINDNESDKSLEKDRDPGRSQQDKNICTKPDLIWTLDSIRGRPLPIINDRIVTNQSAWLGLDMKEARAPSLDSGPGLARLISIPRQFNHDTRLSGPRLKYSFNKHHREQARWKRQRLGVQQQKCSLLPRSGVRNRIWHKLQEGSLNKLPSRG